MQPEVVRTLIDLNNEFYQTFAASFSATRQRLQPGVKRIVDGLPPDANVLDLGCGNGQLAFELVEGGFSGSYLGLDSSAALIKTAAAGTAGNVGFMQRDLSDEDWDQGLPGAPYDIVMCFATLHHIPGEALRLALLEKVRGLLLDGGRFIFSTWQLSNSPKLRARIQPWGRVGLSEGDVDEGDYLMDWRRDGEGLRYVHQFSREELEGLAEKASFEVLESFSSDGATGDLGLYMVWGKG